MTLEYALVKHCAPTLAGLKAGSLFSFLEPVTAGLQLEIDTLNMLLQSKGLTLRLMKDLGSRALCYLYRSSQLARILADPENAAFLRSVGYSRVDLPDALSTLQNRLHTCSQFPHEIGLFLGYPLEDVVGFIRNQGRGCLCCGCWKAYANACDAQKRFDQFGRCTMVYCRLYQAGRPLNLLTVNA